MLAGAAGALLTPNLAHSAAAVARGVTESEITIGMMTDLSGVTAVQGSNAAKAVRMVFDAVDAQGGVAAAGSASLSRTTSTWCPRRCGP